jgi:hypothetical protein
MTPGPDKILKLPASGSLVRISTILSGNTFGGRFWSDGKREAPMLPDAPWLRRQPLTGEFFWTDECEEIAEVEPSSKGSRYEEVPMAATPDLDQLRDALGRGLAGSPEKERYLRTRLWWAMNDPVRAGKATAPAGPGFEQNLVQLQTLFDLNDPDQRLMAVEMARERGDFASATELFEFQFPAGYEDAVAFFKRLTEANDSLVREFA